MMTMTDVRGQVLADVQGVLPSGEQSLLSDYLIEGHYTLVWWYPQALTAAACRSCNGNAEPVELLTSIFSSGCRIVGLAYDSPESIGRYQRDIGVEYPILSVDRLAAEQHGVAKLSHEPWQSIPHRIAFLVNHEGAVINRYEVHDPKVFLRTVLSDVSAGPPTSQWESPKRGLLARLLGK